MQGRILKAIAGFYYVYVVGSGIYACKARGIFRNENRKPLVGDVVEMEVTHEADMEGNVTVIHPRSSELTRPPVANIDQVIILFAMRTPDPNFLLLDRFLIEAQRQKVSCLIAFNKIDEADPLVRKAVKLYVKAGFGFSTDQTKYLEMYTALADSMASSGLYKEAPEG